jgi:hypothetical protein
MGNSLDQLEMHRKPTNAMLLVARCSTKRVRWMRRAGRHIASPPEDCTDGGLPFDDSGATSRTR